MDWEVKDKYFAQSGAYTICWTGGKPTIYSASWRKEFLNHRVKSRETAKRICERHKAKQMENNHESS